GRLRLLRGHGDDDHLALPLLRRGAVLGEAQSCLEGVLVEGVDLPLESGGVDGVAAARDLDPVRVVRVGDALDGDENFHGLPPMFTKYLLVATSAGPGEARPH